MISINNNNSSKHVTIINHQIHQQEIEIAKGKQNWTMTWIIRKSMKNVTIKSNDKEILTMEASEIQDQKWK